ncbi:MULTISPECIES: oligopeptide ABC transporter permease [Peptoniphilus]|uniref:ABC transporter, permease protein n=1 Tax=Peptoniphilus duerdenii ATCC BAA-1640 TaxID=862517 RepID=E0NLF6_9FIRM|nr:MULTISPECIES: oligopeptide ABC transporter permease [Peptoniphilus]EFM25346.1 ABC transporter, permease protein [Peptoniphilus duerdenii ATCC BAA-1640]ERT64964.1 putative oligopeptide ABC transporter, permease protein AppB [Peptoniphilus sp. BV3AC2]MDK8275630.1 ABC transporter permease [Peptoniphilus duerdenii]
MWKTVLRRVLLMIPQLFILSLLIFIMAKQMPGDALTGSIGGNVKPEVLEQIRRESGWYDPWYQQYWRWISKAVQGDFGKSFQYKQPVTRVIGARAANTFALALFATVLSYIIALPLGIKAGRNPGSKFDKGVILYNFISYAMPSFVLYLFTLLLFGYVLKWLPTMGSVDPHIAKGTFAYFLNRMKHLIMPAGCIAVLSTTGTIQYLRNEIIDAKTQDYVKTARSKGVPMKKVYSHHIFRNSLLPIAAFFGFQITGLLGGSMIAERIFNYPGMGNLFIDAILLRDYSVVNALVMLYGFLNLLGSLLSDIIMSIVDPRIRIE